MPLMKTFRTRNTLGFYTIYMYAYTRREGEVYSQSERRITFGDTELRGRLCGLVVTVRAYRSRGPGYQIF
jgi:hypothetical protein